MVLGSKDETAGCQGCVATLQEDGRFTLRVRLPDPVAAHGEVYVLIKDVKFEYGADRLRYALEQQQARAASKSSLQETAKKLEAAGGEPQKLSQKKIKGGAAITWRFMRQADGSWRVAFTTDVAVAEVKTDLQLGMMGCDFNAGFISVTEADRFGNLLASHDIVTPDRGFSSGQREAAMAEAVKLLMAQCVATGKPLALEDLDFGKKKKSAVLGAKKQRKLSALAYAQFKRLCVARAQDAGVEVIFVDPAYSSTQGLVRYRVRRGWSTHQAAAGVIARRGLGLRERAPVRGTLVVPLVGTAVEWPVPVEIGRSDVSRRWPMLHRGLRGAIALHFRVRRAAEQRRLAPKADGGKSGVTGEVPVPKHT
jgi:IS605 OrfB family transposase